MVDYSLDDNTWNAKKTLIDGWFEANQELVGLKVISDGLFTIGDIQSDLRKKHWTSISGIFAHLPNSPIGGGRKSLMPVGVKSDFDTYKDTYYNKMLGVYDVVQGTARTHGKSGGVLYRDMDDGRTEYAKEMTKSESLRLSSAYNAFAANNMNKRYHWDGSFSNEGYPNMVDTQSGGQEEE